MGALSSRLLAAAATATAMMACSVLIEGCGEIDCSETDTCPEMGDGSPQNDLSETSAADRTMAGDGPGGEGTSDSAPPCGPKTCPKGCCNSTGACIASASQTAEECGVGGLSCIECPTGEACDVSTGQCACTATSCTMGCCSSAGSCLLAGSSAQSSTACGIGGAACGMCADECTNGQCLCAGESCPGCCNAAGDAYTCVVPTSESPSSCGAGGVICEACLSGQECSTSGSTSGQCVCDATSCPNGCCTSTGTCQLYASQSDKSCGTAGGACMLCVSGQECNTTTGECICDATSCPTGCCNGATCVLYASQSNTQCGNGGEACAGCICDIASGTCACNASTCPNGCCNGGATGNCELYGSESNSSCGTGGATCAACTSTQECDKTSGECVCDATSCPTGCCSGKTCVLFGSQTNALCGAEGNACSACSSGATCSGGECSCGTSGGTCSGCCSGGTTCESFSNESNTSCGAGGAACAGCPTGTICNGSGQCVCNSTSGCAGCCTSTGTCELYASESNTSCGASGAACGSCASLQECNKATGECVCDASSCPRGCCSGNTCIPLASQSSALCGSSGAACASCTSTTGLCDTTNGTCACDPNTCSTGCCVGGSTGTCEAYSAQSRTSCGTGATTCATCASTQQCVNGNCVCNATSCAGGCCDGNTCVLYASQSTGQCGTLGASCTSCSIGDSCSSGSCTCGGSLCAGCCNGSSCEQLASETNSLCGASGVACGACPTNTTCDTTTGACVCASGFTCVPPVPTGWKGPVAFDEVTRPPAPSCAGTYDLTAVTGYNDPVFSPATCSCACGSVSGGCTQPTVETYTSNMCNPQNPCNTLPVGACTQVTCSGGSQSAELITASAPSGGSCSASANPTVPPWNASTGWGEFETACAASTTFSSAGCSGTDLCAASAPSGQTLCIWQTGDVTCPSSYPTQAFVYSSGTDTRGCANGCTCGAPSGVSCSETITVYGGSGCTGSSTALVGTMCAENHSWPNPAPWVGAVVTPSGGSCATGGSTTASGTITPSGPTTVCCL